MPRRRSRKSAKEIAAYVCPYCGHTITKEEAMKYVVKEWHLTSVSFTGTVTITIMGIIECPKCHKRYRVVLGKKKIDGSGKSPKQRVIEIIKKKKRITLEELSKATKFSVRALRIALNDFIKNGDLKGHFEGDTFVLDE